MQDSMAVSGWEVIAQNITQRLLLNNKALDVKGLLSQTQSSCIQNVLGESEFC